MLDLKLTIWLCIWRRGQIKNLNVLNSWGVCLWERKNKQRFKQLFIWEFFFCSSYKAPFDELHCLCQYNLKVCWWASWFMCLFHSTILLQRTKPFIATPISSAQLGVLFCCLFESLFKVIACSVNYIIQGKSQTEFKLPKWISKCLHSGSCRPQANMQTLYCS